MESSHKRQRTESPKSDSGATKLIYSHDFPIDYKGASSQLKLLEVNAELLEELERDLPSGQVRFTGGENDGAVMVTSCASYTMERIETSNLVLLLAPEGGDKDAMSVEQGDGKNVRHLTASVGYHYELHRHLPGTGLLRSCLLSCPYRGAGVVAVNPYGGANTEITPPTLLELQSRVQMSIGELIENLKGMGAMCVAEGENGSSRWQLLDSELSSRATKIVLSIVEEMDMPLDEVQVNTIVQAAEAEGIEAAVARHCLVSLAKDGGDPDGTIALDLPKVYVYRAHELFQRKRMEEASRLWQRADFLQAWAANVPGVEAPDECLLQGIAILENTGKKGEGETFRYLPSHLLPEDPGARLEKLFATKPRWSLEELRPYMAPLCKPQQALEDLLLKHTRIITDPASEALLYTAK